MGSLFIWLMFSSGANSSFIGVAITKWVIQFFLLSYFCIFRHVVISVVHNCVFVCLLTFLLFDIMCMFACLPYFLQSVYAVLNCFFLAYYSCLQLFDVCRLLAVPLSRFGQLAFTSNSLFLWCRLLLMYVLLRLLCFTLLLGFFWVFLARFVLAFLLCKSASYVNLLLLVFVLCRSVAYFFAPYLLIPIHIVPHASSFPPFPPNDPLWPPWSSLCTSCIFALCACIQNMPCFCPFIAPFALFLLPPLRIRLFAPVCIKVYPSAPIRVIFCIPLRNMMSGEISPAIGVENIMFLPILASVYLVLLCACVPAPQHTHANPCAPICTHIFPSSPCLYVLHM